MENQHKKMTSEGPGNFHHSSTEVHASDNHLNPTNLYLNVQVGVFRLGFSTYPRSKNFYGGSTWYGLFKKSFFTNSCMRRLKYAKCEECQVNTSCTYYRICGEKNARRPFRPNPLRTEQGRLLLELTLIGLSRELLAEVIAAFLVAGEFGIGPRRQKFILETIVQLQSDGLWLPVYDPETSALLVENSCVPLSHLLMTDNAIPPVPWSIHILSPLRVGRDGSLVDLDWGLLFRNLAAELSYFSTVNGENNDNHHQDLSHLKTFLSNPGEIEAEDISFNSAPERYSSRQKKREPMGGYQGTAKVTPPTGSEGDWWLWWRTASLFHLGKKCAMGMGKIIIN